jgi:hypothetical protein
MIKTKGYIYIFGVTFANMGMTGHKSNVKHESFPKRKLESVGKVFQLLNGEQMGKWISYSRSKSGFPDKKIDTYFLRIR